MKCTNLIKTWGKKTASEILANATISPSKMGDWQVWVDLPHHGHCIVAIGTRGDGFGGVVRDVLNIDYQDGRIRLKTTPESLYRLEELVAECEAKQLEELRAQGHLI